MEYNTCCFTGHRPQSLPWGENEGDTRCIALKAKMRHTVEELITRRGFRHFISGMAMGVDTYAAELVLLLRRRYPNITLECAIPFNGQANRWYVDAQRRYYDLLDQADRVTVVAPRYYPGCFQRRNRYMVDQSRCVLAVWNGQQGGTGNTVRYARRRDGVELLLLPPV